MCLLVLVAFVGNSRKRCWIYPFFFLFISGVYKDGSFCIIYEVLDGSSTLSFLFHNFWSSCTPTKMVSFLEKLLGEKFKPWIS